MSASPPFVPIIIIRIAVGVLLAIHGWYRLAAGGVAPFGQFLALVGLPAGEAIAWGITLFEMAGGLVLAAGRYVTPVASGHIAILAGGILLVHGKEGWFVVGGGRNGVEYSLLLLACLIALVLGERRAGRPGRAVPGAP